MGSIPGRGIGVWEKNSSYAICGSVRQHMYKDIRAQIGQVAKKNKKIATVSKSRSDAIECSYF